jgi:MFS family permease
VLAVLAIAELLAMAPWFSASAVAPTLARVWQLSPVTTAWLTISVQLGFVVGALVSAILTLADRLSARRLVAGSTALAAIATLGVAASSGITMGIVCRLLTGAALAGVYPPGMKIAAGWFKEGRGQAIGISSAPSHSARPVRIWCDGPCRRRRGALCSSWRRSARSPEDCWCSLFPMMALTPLHRRRFRSPPLLGF